MKKFFILFSLLALALPVQAQNVGETWTIKERTLRVDSVKGGNVFYTVLVSEETPNTVGRSYKLSLTTFLREYRLVMAPPPPPQDTVVVPSPPSAPAKTLVLYGGDNQSAGPGQTVTESISVRVVDSLGVGIDGDTILWQITSGGGSLNKSFSVTVTEVGRTGWAGARWTLGQSGAQTATATHKKTGQAMTFTATVAGVPPPPPQDTTTPMPSDTGVIASTTFDNVSVIPAPFVAGDGSMGNANVAVAANPFGSGKVLALHFVRGSTGESPDVNRAMALYGLNQNPQVKIGYGQTVYMQSRVYLPTPAANMLGAQRKLFYFQPAVSGGPIGVFKAEEMVAGSTTRQQIKWESSHSGGYHFYPNFTDLEFGRWTTFKVEIKNNSSPTVSDGTLRIWKDGALVLDKTGQKFLSQPVDAWATFLIGQQTQHITGDVSVLFDEWRYWDDVAVGRGASPVPPLPPDTLPADSTVVPPPPAPPVDTSGITVVASCNFSGTTLCQFRNVATAPNTACNFNGVAGQCSADQWLKNGQLAIRYQRIIPITSIDTNRQIDSPDAMVPHGGYLYAAASFYYPSIPPAARQQIDSAYNYWMGTTWKDSTGNKVIDAITDDEHEDALKKGKYGARQLGPNGGGNNHWVQNWHTRILRYSFPMKYDPVTRTCIAGTGLFNVTQVPRGGLLNKWWRIVTLIKRSSGAAVPDGELTVWVNGQQYGPFKNVCTNADNVIQGFGRVSFGQQYQFKGFYYEMRLLDDVVVGKK